jgi:tetratricopeptide (TPR) repeat protein
VAYRRLAQYRRSLAQGETALELARQAGYRVLEGQALTTLGETRLARGDYRRAGEDARAALAAHAETGYRLGTARAHRLLGTALHEAGDPAARRHWCTAKSVYTELGVPEADEVADLLESYVQVS